MRCSSGFTLLELLVVIGVISVLTGLSVGYLGRTDPVMVANGVLAGELRAAQLTARAEGVPTEVLLRPGRDNEAATVQARLLRPVVTFHFEPKEEFEDEVLRPVLGGSDVPSGRFGHARRSDPELQRPLLQWNVTPAVLDLRDGFVVRLDVWLEQRAAATVLRLPPAIELTLDTEGRPRARLRLRGAGGEGTSLTALVSELALPVGQWCTLELGLDGRSAWLCIDGRNVATAVAEGTSQQEPESRFEVSPADGSIPGLVDEIRWFLYTFSVPQLLPIEVVLKQTYRFGFDSRGDATERPTVRFDGREGGV